MFKSMNRRFALCVIVVLSCVVYVYGIVSSGINICVALVALAATLLIIGALFGALLWITRG